MYYRQFAFLQFLFQKTESQIIKVAQSQAKSFTGPDSLAFAITSRDDRENTSCPRHSLVNSFPVYKSLKYALQIE